MKNIAKIFIIFVSSWSLSNAQNIDELAEAFGVLPEIRNVRISPDGTKLLMLQEIDGRTVIVTRDLNNPQEAANGIPLEEGHIEGAAWVNNEKIIASVLGSRYLYLANASNFELRGAYKSIFGDKIILDWQGNNSQELDLRRRIEDLLPHDNEHILVRNGERFYNFNIDSLTEERILMGPLYAKGNAHLDKNNNIRFIEGSVSSTWRNHFRQNGFYRKTMGSEWEKLNNLDIRLTTPSALQKIFSKLLSFAGYTEDPEIVFVFARDENRMNSLYSYNVMTKKKLKKIAWNEKFDLTHAEFDKQYNLDAYYFNGSKPTMIPVSAKYKRLDGIFKKSFPESIANIVSQSRDEKIIIIMVTAPNDPGTYYLLDLNNNTMIMLGYIYQGVDVEQLAAVEFVSYKAKDGMELKGYLTIPNGKVVNNLPTIVIPLKNPASRSFWGFNYQAQFFASLGYAVFQIDYRGASGYGSDYVQNGLFELGDKVVSDINDGTKWLIKQGITDPDRVCIVGHNYGGYAALQANVIEGDLYRCTIVTDPIFNFKIYFNSFMDNYLDTKDIKAEDVSPYHRYKQIHSPLLIIQEERIRKREEFEYQRFTDNLRKSGTLVDVYVIEDLNANNIPSKLKRMGHFLAGHLKE